MDYLSFKGPGIVRELLIIYHYLWFMCEYIFSTSTSCLFLTSAVVLNALFSDCLSKKHTSYSLHSLMFSVSTLGFTVVTTNLQILEAYWRNSSFIIHAVYSLRFGWRVCSMTSSLQNSGFILEPCQLWENVVKLTLEGFAKSW